MRSLYWKHRHVDFLTIASDRGGQLELVSGISMSINIIRCSHVLNFRFVNWNHPYGVIISDKPAILACVPHVLLHDSLGDDLFLKNFWHVHGGRQGQCGMITWHLMKPWTGPSPPGNADHMHSHICMIVKIISNYNLALSCSPCALMLTPDPPHLDLEPIVPISQRLAVAVML